MCFIKECARETSYQTEDLDALTLEHNDLISLPFFTTNHILLQKAMKESVCMALHLTPISSVSSDDFPAITHYFVPEEGKYVKIDDPSSIDKGKAIVTFHACMQKDIIDRKAFEVACETIEGLGFEMIFLCNSADHRQSHDIENEDIIQKKQSPLLQKYKQDAIEIGCSLTNPSLAFINHAYCSVMKP